MPTVSEATLKAARLGPVSISLCQLLEPGEALIAQIRNEIPVWLAAELSNHGVTLSRDHAWQWFLEPLS